MDVYENCSTTSGDVSSIFHASHEVCLTLAHYYVTLGLTLNTVYLILLNMIKL
jgi:hypothetical protein